jgi:hypothetical protein
MNRLLYPKKEIFIMEKGEKFLTSKFFGGDLSTYVFWASITNQFQNCKLTSIIRQTEIFFETERLYSDLVNLYQDTITTLVFNDEEGNNLNYFSIFKLYFELEQSVIGDMLVYIDGNLATKKQFDTIRLYLLNITNFKEFTPSSGNEIKGNLYDYYLQSCVKYSKEVDIKRDYTVDLEMSTYQMDKDTGDTIFLFKEWNFFIELIKNSVKDVKGRGKELDRKALNTKPSEDFVTLFNERQMRRKLNELMSIDKFLKTDIFPFKDTFSKIKNDEKIINFFYSLLVGISFPKADYTKVNNVRHHKVLQTNYLDELNLNNLLYDDIPEFFL